MTTTMTQAAVLGVADRCDVCDAQAFVRAQFVAGSLFFCGHHFVMNEDALKAKAFEITDERNRINAKPSESSA